MDKICLLGENPQWHLKKKKKKKRKKEKRKRKKRKKRKKGKKTTTKHKMGGGNLSENPKGR